MIVTGHAQRKPWCFKPLIFEEQKATLPIQYHILNRLYKDDHQGFLHLQSLIFLVKRGHSSVCLICQQIIIARNELVIHRWTS